MLHIGRRNHDAILTGGPHPERTGRDRLIGLLDAAVGNEGLSPDELREIVIFLTHGAGWPSGAKVNSQVQVVVARAAKRAEKG